MVASREDEVSVRQSDALVADDDEAVPLERARTASPSRSSSDLRCPCDEAKRRRTPLAERALERPLPARQARRDVPRDGHVLGQRARRRSVAHARCRSVAPRSMSAWRGRSCEGSTRAAQDALDVDVDREHVLAEGEAADGGRGVRPDAGQLGQVVRPAGARRSTRAARCRLHRAPVVAEPLPLADRRRPAAPRRAPRRSASARATPGSAGRRARPASAGASPRETRIAYGSRSAPRKIAAVLLEPVEQERLHPRAR